MISSIPKPILLAVCLAVPIVFFLSLILFNHPTSRWGKDALYQVVPWASGQQSDDDLARIASNRTLGFGKIAVIGLKERSDKRDSMVLAASLTGFDVDFVDGLRGEDIPDKVMPGGMDKVTLPERGSWRAHMNTVRSLLESDLSSIFIMEDDVDWDIRIKQQLPQFAKAVRTLGGSQGKIMPDSPYGDDWDIVWPGHCGEQERLFRPEDSNGWYEIHDDPTVPPREHQVPFYSRMNDWPDGTRVVHRAVQPICTFAYGVSRRGALKLLMILTMQPFYPLPFDLQLAIACRDMVAGLRCWTVEPELFNHHRPAGPISKDSDIKVGTGKSSDSKHKGPPPGTERKVGFTQNIVLSARLNVGKMIMGETDYITQY